MSSAAESTTPAEGGAPRMTPLEKSVLFTRLHTCRYKLVFLGDPGVGNTAYQVRGWSPAADRLGYHRN